ncbi:MAG: hypothetical protein M2R45_03520 [Verrucomicrobia subdivision 3 bacterium]|nr:hypothetical protein [Limisphaerales bacterium]MCS1415917.1 hypothetical protein [Limisphaerales bacterium]
MNTNWVDHLKPITCALLFLLRHWFTFATIRRGEMSVVPAMGTKAIFVAIGAWVWFDKAINPMWLAAVLAALRIYIMERSDTEKTVGLSVAITLTILISACFGFCATALQAWALEYGSMGFMSAMFLAIALIPATGRRTARDEGRPEHRSKYHRFAEHPCDDLHRQF